MGFFSFPLFCNLLEILTKSKKSDAFLCLRDLDCGFSANAFTTSQMANSEPLPSWTILHAVTAKKNNIIICHNSITVTLSLGQALVKQDLLLLLWAILFHVFREIISLGPVYGQKTRQIPRNIMDVEERVKNFD